MKKEPINRVEHEQQLWESKEKRFLELFKSYPKAIESRSFLTEKLNFYEAIEKTYGKSSDSGERMAAKFLAEQKRELERKLFPTRTLRFLRWVFKLIKPPVAPFQVDRMDHEELSKQKIRNKVDRGLQRIKRDLIVAGLGSAYSDVAKQFREGRQDILTKVSLYFTPGERTNITAAFSSAVGGVPKFIGYKMDLDEALYPGEQRTQKFSWGDGEFPSVRAAYNQLNGRPVLREWERDGVVQRSLVSLDFNDKESNGNYRKVEIPINNQNEFEGIFERLNLKMAETDKDNLIAGLKAGNTQNITVDVKGEVMSYRVQLDAHTGHAVLNDENGVNYTVDQIVKKQQELSVVHRTENPVVGGFTRKSDLKIVNPNRNGGITLG